MGSNILLLDPVPQDMTSVWDMWTWATEGDSGTLSRGKHEYWRGYQKHYGRIYFMKLTDVSVIILLHVNLLIVTQELKRVFQVMSEG